jgi:hypothetical protein
MSHVTCDENGFVRGLRYHDGSFDGLLLGTDRTVHIAIRAVSGELRVITLMGVTALCVNSVREGNVLLNLRILRGAQAASDAEVVQTLAERVYLDPSRLGDGKLIFLLESSYGADAIAVCDSVEVSEPGGRLIVSDRP